MEMTIGVTEASPRLFDDLDAAISLRLRRANQAVAASEAPDQFTGLTLAERVAWSNSQAERYGRKAEDAANRLSSLLKDGRWDDADRVVESSAAPAVAAAEREAVSASDAALELQRQADQAAEAVEQARALVALGPSVEPELDPAWLSQTTARMAATTARVDRAVARARDAGYLALTATSTSIQANVALGRAKANVNVTKASREILRELRGDVNANRPASFPAQGV
jgi:hypothetical protein